MKQDELPIEGIAEMRLAYVLLNWRDNLDNTTVTPQDVAKSLIKILKEEFGYRRIDPPMTDIPEEASKEVKKILEHYFSEELGEGASTDIAEEILEKAIPIITKQAQEDAREKVAEYLYKKYGRSGGLDWSCLWEGDDLKYKCRKEATQILEGKDPAKKEVNDGE